MVFSRLRMNDFGRFFSFRVCTLAALLGALTVGSGCRSMKLSNPGGPAPRAGDEIMVAGNLVHTGTKVVLWMDPGGYDAYRVEKRFGPYDKSDYTNEIKDMPELARRPARYRMRRGNLTPTEVERA